MHPCADAIVAGARSCVGTRFRVHGRVIGVGLDCLGVVVVAGRAAGVEVADRADYALSGSVMVRLDSELAAALDPVSDAAAGDVLLFEPAPGFRHLGVWTGTTLIHAHAGLRRVVEGPVPAEWWRIGAFRFRED